MEKIWLKNYPGFVPEEVQTPYSSICDLLNQNAKKFADKPAFHCLGTTFSFKEIDRKAKRFAGYLQNDLKLQKGDRVALMMPNTLQYPIALHGVLHAGLIAVNVNPLYTPRELEHQLIDSGAKAIIIYDGACASLEKIIHKTSVKHVFRTGIGDMLSFPKSAIVNFVLKHVKKMVPKYSLKGSMLFNDAIALGNSNNFQPIPTSLDDYAFLQYTGGTTGVSKGAILSHGNICMNVTQALSWLHESEVKGDEIIITPLPLYHIFSLTANLFGYSTLGGLNILIPNPRDLDGFIKEIKKWEFTALTGVNTLFNMLVNHPDFKTVDFTNFRMTLGGGMAVTKDVANKWKEVTGSTLIEAYGLTETSPAACVNPIDLPEYNGKIGMPIPSTIMDIRDEDNKSLAIGEVGEVCIKGPQVMQGYWQRPEETKKVMTEDGFFKSGDMGFMDEKGFFKLVDRKKDMILVGGFNVFPNEIEDIVSMHPKVFESAAIGIPNEKSGEVVKLFIVKKEESLTEEELKKYCKENLTGYKVPRHFEFKDELPKSNVGKILRKDLRDLELNR